VNPTALARRCVRGIKRRPIPFRSLTQMPARRLRVIVLAFLLITEVVVVAAVSITGRPYDTGPDIFSWDPQPGPVVGPGCPHPPAPECGGGPAGSFTISLYGGRSEHPRPGRSIRAAAACQPSRLPVQPS
jgi:hypothetical protein